MNSDPAEAPSPQMLAGAQFVGYAANECAKEARPRDTSYIDHQPDNQVVLSPRLEQLARRIGGCQTDEVLALVRRIMYEVILKTGVR